MKKLFILVAAIGMLYSCGGGQKQTETVVSDVDSLAQEVVTDLHNAKNSLDYKGTYKGEIPAASASGIIVSLTLDDSTYVRTMEYVGKKGKPLEEKGVYEWNKDGNTVILKGIEAPNQYFVGENTLTQLDIEGNKITGDLADKYILRK